MNSFVQDLRYGVRMLLRSPGPTAAALVALALGIGANTSIFSVVNAVLLRPLPYPGADRLLSVHQTWTTTPGEHDVLSTDDVVELREGANVLKVAAYYSPVGGFALTGEGDPEMVRGTTATAELFGVLGVSPALGRGFLPGDDEPGAEPVVVLSHSLWERRFHGDSTVIGRAIQIDDRSHTIVGVMPAGFRFPSDTVADLWPIFRPERSSARPPFYIRTVARPRPGADPAAIDRELESITRRIKDRFPRCPLELVSRPRSLQGRARRRAGPALYVRSVRSRSCF
jgi:hypothetical protein